jgi:hypothetical protein
MASKKPPYRPPTTYQFVVAVEDLNLPSGKRSQVPTDVECRLESGGVVVAVFPLRLLVGQNDRCRQGVRSTSEVNCVFICL